MPRTPSNRIPKYRLHKASGQAVVTLDGRDFYLGDHGTASSRQRYERLVGEWLAGGRRLPVQVTDEDPLTVNELLASFWRHAEVHYRSPTGEPTSELDSFIQALKPLRKLYGDAAAIDALPTNLRPFLAGLAQFDRQCAKLCRPIWSSAGSSAKPLAWRTTRHAYTARRRQSDSM